jgi:hypothetical protein
MHAHLEANVVHNNIAVNSHGLQVALGKFICEAADLLGRHRRAVLQHGKPAALLPRKPYCFRQPSHLHTYAFITIS